MRQKQNSYLNDHWLNKYFGRNMNRSFMKINETNRKQQFISLQHLKIRNNKPICQNTSILELRQSIKTTMRYVIITQFHEIPMMNCRRSLRFELLHSIIDCSLHCIREGSIRRQFMEKKTIRICFSGCIQTKIQRRILEALVND